jgi:two-component system, NtrC family, sensor kinase
MASWAPARLRTAGSSPADTWEPHAWTRHSTVRRRQLAEGLPGLFGEPVQLGQVVLNLLQNGLCALKAAHREGTLKPVSPQEGSLSIAHHMVEEHGGRFQVASVPGEGATFTVYLPIPRPFEKE